MRALPLVEAAFMESVNSLAAVEAVNFGETSEVLLPCQFFGSVGARTFSSEQRLVLAVLVDAINLVLRENRDSGASFKEASSWIFANGIASLLSFDLACDAVGLDAECLRKRLSELISQRVSLRRMRLREPGRRPALTTNNIRQR